LVWRLSTANAAEKTGAFEDRADRCDVASVKVRTGRKPMMTPDEQEAARQERLNEVGTMPPCPFCHRPRVERSGYIRCNPCGKNWLNGEDITKDPRASRTRGIPPTKTETGDGAPPAR
jgi:ribosomal protein L37AE/L43A